MAAALNLNGLFSEENGYLHALKVPDVDARVLRAARDEIRATLRAAFAGWVGFIDRHDLFEDARQRPAMSDRLASPRFKMQGSWAYRTENDCQRHPPQEIDLDDGVYLPMSFMDRAGNIHPQVKSKAYFALVEKALAPLCARRRWILNPGEPKPNCVRIKIGPRLHTDLALYAVRDASFETLAKSAASQAGPATDGNDVELSDDIYKGFAASDIFLANRVKGWIISDPRLLDRWLDAALKMFGPIVRHASRDFKGLRDATWSDCELSSICIMAAIVDGLQTLNPKTSDWAGRDDIALAKLARHIAQRLRRPIDNPVLPGNTEARLCNGWSHTEREQICDLFKRAADELDEAIYGDLDREAALKRVRAVFGTRIPNDVSLIKTIGAPMVIRSTAPEPQPRPAVPRHRSG